MRFTARIALVAALALCAVPAWFMLTDVARADEIEGFSPVKVEEAPAASSSVQVCFNLGCTTGHGSGVYIGNGYFLTAGHVMDANRGNDYILKAEDGRIIKAEGVYRLVDHDIALLKATQAVLIPQSELYCGAFTRGQRVTAIGNPAMFEFVYAEGYLAVTRPNDYGPWTGAIAVLLPAAGGFSGGAVFNEDDQVIGLVVGGLNANMNYAIMEPMSKICDLLPNA